MQSPGAEARNLTEVLKYMKKITVLFMTAALALGTVTARAAEQEYKIPDVKAYVLIEAETGEILYSHNESEQLPVSSLAKLKLLHTVSQELRFGNINLTDEVPAPASVMNTKAPTIWLDPGEVMPLGELAKAVIMSSSNDAAVTLAEYLGVGFDAEAAASAYEVALIAAELFKYFEHDPLAGFYSMRLSEVRAGTERETQLVNTNRMAQWYEGIMGGKTGHGTASGFCIANCAKRGDMRLIAVVLGARDADERDSLCEFLLDSGFGGFEYVTPEVDVSEFSPVKVTRGVEKLVKAAPECPMTFIAAKGEGGSAELTFTLPESVSAPVTAGQVLGRMVIKLGDRVVAECDIIALHDVEELTFWKSLRIMSERFFRI